MIRRIIVEGADQQGKTTLCKLLQEKLGWEIIHYGKPTEDFDFMTGYKLPVFTISDRNFLSEVVYSKVNGKQSRAAITLQSNIHKHDETLLILLDREDHWVFDRKRHEDYKESDIVFARSIYQDEFKKVNMEKMRLNPNCEDYMKHVQAIIDLANDSI